MVRSHVTALAVLLCLGAAAPVRARTKSIRQSVSESRFASAHPATRRALIVALTESPKLDGHIWLGSMAELSGRDALVYIPAGIDVTRPVELILFMEGFCAFATDAMGRRHLTNIRSLESAGRNFVYVSPEVPTSVHRGDRRSKVPYWSRRCFGLCKTDRAPGDFPAFYRRILNKVEERLGSLAVVELTLVGFSRGGIGIQSAVDMLARSSGDVRLETVGLSRVIFADALYNKPWIARTWDRVHDLPTLEEVSLIVADGGFKKRRGPGQRNRDVARWFLGRALPGWRLSETAPLQRRGVFVVQKFDMTHNGIGDLAARYRPGVGESLRQQ